MRPKMNMAVNKDNYIWLLSEYCDEVEKELEELKLTVQRVKDELKPSKDLAMKNTISARIPECGDFASIAQSLDYCCNELSGYSGDLVSLRSKLRSDVLKKVIEKQAIIFRSQGEEYDRGYRTAVIEYDSYIEAMAKKAEKGEF